jgi:hypothetical protein
MYVDPNFPTKKALKEAVAAGRTVTVWQPNAMFPKDYSGTRTLSVEGPYYPKPHTWYARVVVQDGIVVSVK